MAYFTVYTNPAYILPGYFIICTAPLNRFYVLWRHRNHRRIIIIINIRSRNSASQCNIWMSGHKLQFSIVHITVDLQFHRPGVSVSRVFYGVHTSGASATDWRLSGLLDPAAH